MSEELSIQALLENVAESIRARITTRPALIGLGGAQGSGKSYQSKAFAASHENVAHFSMDDIYLTKREREALAKSRHPLFATRGPPGTHDLDLAKFVISELNRAKPETETPIPRFDKKTDDRIAPDQWPKFKGRPDIILIDGWCMGAVAPVGSPPEPMNGLEAQEDPHRIWRNHMLAPLATQYPIFFRPFDAIVYLQAPGWEIVRAWRIEQEVETQGRALTLTEVADIERFIEHYERVTRAMLAGQHRANWIVRLDESRNVIGIEQRLPSP
ncbi:MAG: kinase [Hyphomonadaceae bacterium]